MDKKTRHHRVRFLSTMVAMGLGVFTWLMGTALPTQAATSGNVGLRLHILNPPNAITDLSAAPVGSSSGDVQLTWTAPSNANGIAINHYLIRYATFPAPSQAAAEAWWTSTSASQQLISPAFSPGTQEFTTLNGLTVGVTYYFGIKSVDNDGSVSPIDDLAGTVNQAQSQPLDLGSAPPTPTNFVGVAISSTRIQWSWNAAFSATTYSLYDNPTDTLVATTAALNYIETGLSPNFFVARHLRAENSNGTSSPTSAQSLYTLAAIPNGFSITDVGFADITLAWNSNGNPTGTLYRIERSLDDINYSNVYLGSNLTFQDTGLLSQTTYYYRLRAINGDSMATAPTVSLSTVTLLQVDFVIPEAPAGLKGTLDSTGLAFTLTWEAPIRNTDGTVVSDLAGYNIYRRSTLTGTPSLITPNLLTIRAFADQVDGETYFYTVHAVDTSGNESGPSLIADSSPFENVIFLANDGISQVSMPDEINNLLRSTQNKYGVPLTITLNEMPVSNQTNVLRHIRLNLVRIDNGTTLNDLAFAKPQALIGVGYNIVNGQITTGKPGSAGEQKFSASAVNTKDLSLYWHNGVTWVKVGGTLDASIQSILTKSSFLGDYQIRTTGRAVSLNLEQANVYPRVITPNNDGFNDRVYFVLENPNSAGVRGEILDMQGRLVKTLPNPDTNTGIGTTFIWDGTDNAGSVVPAGAYLYRIKGEGKTFTGTVAVAR